MTEIVSVDSVEEAKRSGVNYVSKEQLGRELLAGKQRAVARLNRGVQQLRSAEWEATMQHDGKTFEVKGKYIVTEMPKRSDDKKRCEQGLAIAKRMVQELKGGGFVVKPFLMTDDSFSFSAEHQSQADATPPVAVRDSLDVDAPLMTEVAAIDLGAKRQAPGVVKDQEIKARIKAEKTANQKPADGGDPLAAGEVPPSPGEPGAIDPSGPPANELPETLPSEPSTNSK